MLKLINKKNNIFIYILILISVLLYVFTLRGIYGNPNGNMIKNNLDQATRPFELSPERGRYILSMSLADNKSFSLSQTLADAAYPDVGYYQGRFYINFAPGISLISLPFYLIGKYFNLSQMFSFFSISIFALLNIFLLFKISKNLFKLPDWISVFVSIVFAFASTSWSYAITLYQHHVTTFFIISSFYAVWKYKQNKKRSFFWAIFIWFNYALAILIDYPNAILMLPIMIYFFLSSFKISKLKEKIQINFRLGIVLTSFIFILITGLHGYYNFVNFGGWNKVSGGLVSYKIIKEQKLLNKQSGKIVIEQMKEKKDNSGFFKEERIPFGIYELLIAPDKGIFVFSPIFILALVGIFFTIKQVNLEKAILLATVGVNLFLYSSWGDPWGGWAYGPRYLIISMAVLSIFIGIFLHKIKFKLLGKIVTFVLFAFSSAVALLGALTTNAVPPKIEADYLNMKYGFMLNIDFLKNNRSGTFVYSHFLSDNLSLINYFLIIFAVLLLMAFIVLFILPKIEKNEN
ncbi:MAG: hypothetical protein A2857_06730 [Candidatus Levybacteria bacterium RIFCSPHIGHO2_01_FULL_36_15]|nr:MAG: hypothetical protein A2857_06730 [Candidatus Levybacteria bacterium RIFCSPHIGHO2_01_FULL_36_15]OGH37793.1 MAG: hypothetical protein A2905_00055 [Candidatus Levybacteria bacterium RIFCSPLOWO2_01_FULL_36_10]